MANENFITGKDGKVTVEGTEIPITKWDAEGKAELIDRTNSKSAGHMQYGVGLKSCSGSCEAHWDGGNNMMDAPGIIEGANVALRCYLAGTSGPYLDVPEALVESVKPTLAINGGVDFTFSWKANGTFTWPTGNV